MSRKFTILATALNAVGHVNAVCGALRPLLERGHRVVFVLEEAFRNKLSPNGFIESIYCIPKAGDETNPGEFLAKEFQTNKVIGDYDVWEKMKNIIKMFHGDRNYREFEAMNRAIEAAIEQYKPDFIHFDGPFLYPAISYSGIPWIYNYSTNPLCFILDDTNEIPPGWSGFASNENPEIFVEFNQLRKYYFFNPKISGLIRRMGYEPYPNDSIFTETQCLTVYAYPNELNYPYVARKDWFNLEVFNKPSIESSKSLQDLVPQQFFTDQLDGKWSGKWIYVSMGSMGSIDLELMSRVIEELRQTAHKYIVSKGPRHSEYQLPANMYGERFLQQTEILPHMDAVITHGGNNSFTETFAVGVPMIVMPLFGDQFDNAQRVAECSYGECVQPYSFGPGQLCAAVELVLTDQALRARVRTASERIQAEDRHQALADKVENINMFLTS